MHEKYPLEIGAENRTKLWALLTKKSKTRVGISRKREERKKEHTEKTSTIISPSSIISKRRELQSVGVVKGYPHRIFSDSSILFFFFILERVKLIILRPTIKIEEKYI